MKKQGYSEHTINFVRKALVRIQNGCNFTDPDDVKAFIAKLDVAESYKRNLCYAYEHYLKLNGLSWEKRPSTMLGIDSLRFQRKEHSIC